MKMEQTERSEMSAYKIPMPVNYPEESTQWQIKAFGTFSEVFVWQL